MRQSINYCILVTAERSSDLVGGDHANISLNFPIFSMLYMTRAEKKRYLEHALIIRSYDVKT